jgi:hypothetical protein
MLLHAGLGRGELAGLRFSRGSRGPVHPFKEQLDFGTEARCDFDHGVYAGDASAALQQSYLGSVQRRTQAELFLRDADGAAQEAQVLAELVGDLYQSISKRAK